MSPQATINAWLKELSTDLALDENGVCSFSYHDELECALECPENSDMLYLYTPLAPLPPDDDLKTKAEFYEHVLKLNLFGRETAGGALALDDQEKAILFCYTHPIASLDPVSFGNLLTGFVETAMKLKGRLKSVQPGHTPDDSPQSPPFDPSAHWNSRA